MTNHRLNRGQLEALIAILNHFVPDFDGKPGNAAYDEYGYAVHEPVDMTGMRIKLAQQLNALK
jgi:hypothetical protein